MSTHRKQKGFTVFEMLVAMLMFSFVLVGVSQTLLQSTRRLGYERRMATAVAEARQVIQVLSTEVRMASSLSPYLLTLNEESSRCSHAVTVGDNGSSLTLRISHDEPMGDQGRESMLVGYRFNEETGELLRGEVPLSSHNCSTSGDDPLNDSIAQVIARNLSPIDVDGNGINEKPFVRDGSLVLVNLGLEVETSGAGKTEQLLPLSISVRSL